MHQADIGDINAASYELHTTCHPQRFKPRRPSGLDSSSLSPAEFHLSPLPCSLAKCIFRAGDHLIILRMLDVTRYSPTVNDIFAIYRATLNCGAIVRYANTFLIAHSSRIVTRRSVYDAFPSIGDRRSSALSRIEWCDDPDDDRRASDSIKTRSRRYVTSTYPFGA